MVSESDKGNQKSPASVEEPKQGGTTSTRSVSHTASSDSGKQSSVVHTASVLREIAQEGFEGSSPFVRYRNYLIKNTIKGLALGFICDSYLFGKDYFVYIFSVVYSAFLADFELLNHYLQNQPDARILIDNLSNPEYLFIGVLILISCIGFGLWDGWREDRIRSLALRDRERGERLLGVSQKLAKINETLERLSITDDLTGLFNRRYANQQLSYEISRCLRVRNQLCVMMVDIDYFKKVNDTFGHETGDIVLRQLSIIMVEVLRKEDVVCRYGGEEFLIILPGIDMNGAKSAGKRLLEHISRESFFINGNEIPITVSIGVSATEDELSVDYLELVRKADLALYKAKNAGRNRMCAYTRDDREEYVEMFTFQPEKRLEELSAKINDLRMNLRESSISSIQSLINAIGTRDSSLLEHMRETAYHARYTAIAAGLKGDDVDTVFRAALLHDIGKMGISDALLTKREPLEASDRIALEQHPEMGARILAPLGFLRIEAQLIKCHHERYDGLGYPEGLSEKSIPLGSSIISVCSAFVFMKTNHPFREAMTERQATEEIRRNRGTQFDPRAVDAFLDYISNTQRFIKSN